ncbi:MAG: YraN family protein [Chitinophagaceae bacterium]
MNSKQIGEKGESIAVDYLIEKGFIVIEKNWRFKHLEIDIIASLKNTLHFVEVKTRTNQLFGHPEESISELKMNRLKRAAEAYLIQQPQWEFIQFDVVAITLHANEVADLLFIEDVFF